MNSRQKAREDAKKSLRRSRRLTLIDLLIILGIVAGLIYFYNLSAENAKEMQQKVNKADLPAAVLGKVTFYDDQNRQNIAVTVEVAESSYEQSRGLMFRKDIPENQGMLFIYNDEDIRHFWMRNTEVPLDIIFVNGNYRIVTIHKETEPFSERLYGSTAPAQFVVEVRAGFSDRYNIREGQRISWELL